MLNLLIRLIGLVLIITSGWYISQSLFPLDIVSIGYWTGGLIIGILLFWQPWNTKKRQKIGTIRLPPPETLR